MTEATKWFGPGLTSGAATARQCSNGLFTPPAAHFTPEPSQTQAPVTPATEPERRAGGSLTTVGFDVPIYLVGMLPYVLSLAVPIVPTVLRDERSPAPSGLLLNYLRRDRR